MQALAELAASLGETERARTLLEESLRRHTQVFGEGHERTARVLHALAPVVATTDLDAGGRLLLRAVEIHRARLPPDDPVRATALGSLAGYYTQRAEYDRAKDTYQQALAVFPTPQARRHPSAITHPQRLSRRLLGTLNQHAEAEAMQREALDVGRQVARRGHAGGGEPGKQPGRDAEPPRASSTRPNVAYRAAYDSSPLAPRRAPLAHRQRRAQRRSGARPSAALSRKR